MQHRRSGNKPEETVGYVKPGDLGERNCLTPEVWRLTGVVIRSVLRGRVPSLTLNGLPRSAVLRSLIERARLPATNYLLTLAAVKLPLHAPCWESVIKECHVIVIAQQPSTESPNLDISPVSGITREKPV